MTFVLLILLTLIAICPVLSDIPDNVLDSGICEVIEHAGDDHLIDVMFTETDSITYCFGYTVSCDSTDIWVLTIDYSGVPVDRLLLCTQQGNYANRVTGTFRDSELLILIDGDKSPHYHPEFHTIDLINPDNSRHVVLPAEVSHYENLTLISLKNCHEGQLLAAGTRCSAEDAHALFVMKLGYDGTILWETTLVENAEKQFIRASMEILNDGGCVISYGQDCFPSSSIPVFRLGSNGQISWQKSLPVDCELTACLSGFLELDDGRMLCTGTVDYMKQMAYRGYVVCLDAQGEELWSRFDWYLDHTSFISAVITPQDDFLITGWTGEEGDSPLEAVNTDVLLVIMDNDGSRIIGTELSAEGDQVPHSIFLTESGQIIVTGTEVQPGKEEADVFFWKLDLEEIGGSLTSD